MHIPSPLPETSGVYVIRNTITGEEYIGGSSSLTTRHAQHVAALEKGTHHSHLLQQAWTRHGRDVFRFEVLEYILSAPTQRARLLEREAYHIAQRSPAYNTRQPEARSYAGSSMPIGAHPREDLISIPTVATNPAFFPPGRTKGPSAGWCYRQIRLGRLRSYSVVGRVFVSRSALKRLIFEGIAEQPPASGPSAQA